MSNEKKRWRPSPPLIVITTVLVILGMTLLAGWLNARRYRVKVRVEIAEPAVKNHTAPVSTAGNAINLPDGEVAKTAARVRESTGLLLGLAMVALTEQMNNRTPATADALIELMAKRNLLPPSLRQTSVKGALVSDRATIYVLYRAAPLGIEVASVGKERADGPPVIARLAAGGDDSSGAVLLVAGKAETRMPAPLAPLSQVIAAGWNVEPLRERSFTPEEVEQLNTWARQYAAAGK